MSEMPPMELKVHLFAEIFQEKSCLFVNKEKKCAYKSFRIKLEYLYERKICRIPLESWRYINVLRKLIVSAFRFSLIYRSPLFVPTDLCIQASNIFKAP